MTGDEAITAIKTWEGCMRKSNKGNDFAEEFIDAAVLMCNVLDQEGEPVRHGHWILEREPNGKPFCYHCSACDDDFTCIGITVAYNFCPNCGAKMDEVEDGKEEKA